MVSTCKTTAMLVQSDHEAVLLTLDVEKPPRQERTSRQMTADKATIETFGYHADINGKQKAIGKIVRLYEKNDNGLIGEYERLMHAVQTVIASLPKKTKTVSGWLDTQHDSFHAALYVRNERSRQHARQKSDETKQLYKEARQHIKKMKK